MLGIQCLLFFLLTLVCLVRMNNEIIGRTACFAELLAFYHNDDTSCAFNKALFMAFFKDNRSTCQVECTLKTLTPKVENRRRYELQKMEINFLDSFNFTLMKSCWNAANYNVKMALTCDEKGFYGFQTNSLPNLTKPLSAEIPATTLTYSSKEMAKNSDPPVGIIVGAAAAGFVSGIIVCGIVCFILSRCKKSTSTKRSVEFAATVDNYGFEVAVISSEKTEHKTVQVSEESSRSDVNRKGGTVPLDDIYNHLHETSGMSGIEPEHDHVPCNGTDDETYHHLNLGNTKNVNTVTLADWENHYN